MNLSICAGNDIVFIIFTLHLYLQQTQFRKHMHILHKITRLQTRGSNHTHATLIRQFKVGSPMFSLRWLGSFLTTHTILRLCRPGRKTDRGANWWVETREWRTVTTTLRFKINIQPTEQNETPRVHWLGAGWGDRRRVPHSHVTTWTLGAVNGPGHCPWYGTDQPRARVVPVKHKTGLLSRKANSSFSEKRCHIQS